MGGRPPADPWSMKRVLAVCLSLLLALVPVSVADAAAKGKKGKTTAAKTCKAAKATASAKKAKKNKKAKRSAKACAKAKPVKPKPTAPDDDFTDEALDREDADEPMLEELEPETDEPVEALRDDEPAESFEDEDVVEATFSIRAKRVV